jgi:hypoxanthine-DNA glycosylase
MHWQEVRQRIRSELLSRDLEVPRPRLSALETIGRPIGEVCPDFTDHCEVVLEIEKRDLSSQLAVLKSTGRLNGAEKSVLNQILTLAHESQALAATLEKLNGRHSQTPANEVCSPEPTLSHRATFKAGLSHVAHPTSRILIVGSMPGDDSIKAQRYYANVRNQLWRILSEVYGEAIGSRYADRLTFLRRHGIALWDVLQGAERIGSLDSKILNPVPNDFEGFLRDYPDLTIAVFNGTKAQSLFTRYVERRTGAPFREICLPSTSAMSGRNVLSFKEKVARWTVLRSL